MLLLVFLLPVVTSRVIHEYAGSFSDPREEVFVYREISLESALPINLSIIANKLINASIILDFQGMIVRNPRCHHIKDSFVRTWCKDYFWKGTLPQRNGVIDNIVPWPAMFPVMIRDKASGFMDMVLSRNFTEHAVSCMKSLTEYTNYYACVTPMFLILWERNKVSVQALRLQLFRMQLIALQSNMNFEVTVDYDEEGDVYWQRMESIKRNFVSPSSCNFLDPSLHDSSFCSIPSCDSNFKHSDCVVKPVVVRKKRQWDVASFAIATGAAVLAGLNRAEIEHLKGQISGLVDASKAHEKQVVEVGNKLISFMKTTNAAFDSVHHQIIRLADETSKQLSSLSENMQHLLNSQNALAASIDAVSSSVGEMMRVTVIEIQNRGRNFMDLVKLSAIMYHEGRIHRIRNAIKNSIITEDMLSKRQLKMAILDRDLNIGLSSKGLVPMIDDDNIEEYLNSPVFSAKYHNSSFLELAIRIPVKRAGSGMYAFRMHCLAVLHKLEGVAGYGKEYCPPLPYMVVYSEKKTIYYEISREEKHSCFLGSFIMCRSFLKPMRRNDDPLKNPCYLDFEPSAMETSISPKEDGCSSSMIYSDGSLEIIILDSGKIYISTVSEDTKLYMPNGIEIPIPGGSVVPIEARCATKLESNGLEYHLPNIFCENEYEAIIGKHHPVGVRKFESNLLGSYGGDLIKSAESVYKILTSKSKENHVDIALPKDIKEKYNEIVNEAKVNQEKYNLEIDKKTQDLETSLAQYKRKLDEIHSELDVSRSYLFWMVIVSFISAVFLFFDVMIALIFGQTICGMIARKRRGEPVMRTGISKSKEETVEMIIKGAFADVSQITVTLGEILPGRRIESGYREIYKLIISLFIPDASILARCIGLQYQIMPAMKGSPSEVIKGLFLAVGRKYGKEATWAIEAARNPNIVVSSFVAQQIPGSPLVATDLLSIHPGGTFRVINIVNTSSEHSVYEDVS